MAKKTQPTSDLAAELEGFIESDKPSSQQVVASPVRRPSSRSGSRSRKAADKVAVRNEDIVEGTNEIDVSGFVAKLGETVREKSAKQERVFNLLNNKSVRAALKEFVDEIGGVHLAYDRLILVAPDVKKSTFVKAWRECGYGSSSAAE